MDVFQRAGSGESRGQLILVTGLALAVALVVLVLLVNTAIFTENLASRDVDVGEDDALEYRQVIREGVGGIIDRENAAEYSSYPNVKANSSEGVAELNRRIVRSNLEDGKGTTINTSDATYHEGALVRQTNASRNFSDKAGSRNWTVATDINDTRGFTTTVEKSELIDISLASVDPSDSYHLVLQNSSGDEWHAYVYKDTATNEIVVAVKNASESSATEICRTADSNATVDFTQGTLDGESCSGLDWARGLEGSYDVLYKNGNETKGTYNMTLNVSGTGSVNDGAGGSLNSGPGSDSPYSVPAVYSVVLNVSYQSPSLEYEDQIRVAPGEPDD